VKQSKIIFVLMLNAFIATIFLSGCSGSALQTRDMLISPQRELVNYALSSSGATAESPDNNPDHPPSAVIDGSKSSLDWDNGGGWEGNLSHLRNEDFLKRSYIQINLPGKKQVKRIVVYTIDSPKYPAKKFGLNTYRLEYWHGTGWEKVNVARDNQNVEYTVKDNRSGKIVHDVVGDLITDRIRLVPILSNDVQKLYNFTGFGGEPVFDIKGSAKVIEMEVWCYPTVMAVTGPVVQANLFPAGKSQPSPDEQEIRKVLYSYKQGYDNENLELVISGFSDEFLAQDGKKKSDIKDKASKFFEEYSSVKLTFRDTQVNIAPSGDTATAQANYILECVAKADNNIYRRSGTLTFNFRKEEGANWKIIDAR